jgi:cobalt-zinc-cadmium efflux system membrane fusion protein
MRRCFPSRTLFRLFALAAIAGTLFVPRADSFAHENHAPLPTKGVKIVGDQIMISAKGRDAIGMTTAKVALGNLNRVVSVNAKVELPWRQQAMIASLVSGKIEQVLVRPGETVAAGQELARIISIELESLQAELLQADTEIKLADRILAQRKSLDQEGAIAGKSLLEAETTLAQKTAQRGIARQKLLALGLSAPQIDQILASQKSLGSLSLKSPLAGTVTHADVRVGQVVAPTDHLYHVVDLSTLWVVGEVLEADVAHLRKGQGVEADFAASPGKKLQGKIDHLRLKLDPRSRTQSVVIAVDNRDNLLRPGMFGQLKIEVQVAKDAIFCPADALTETRTGTYVLVQRGEGKYVNQPVQVGLRQKEKVEILDGLFPGDQVVVVGNYLLASLLGNEHKARVKTPAAPESLGSPSKPAADPRAVVVAQASIELPTDRQVFAVSRIEGRLAKICVDPSQPVRAGQVLAEVDSLELRNTQLELLQVLTQWHWTQESLRRLQNVAEGGGILQKQLRQLQNDDEVLKQKAARIEHKLSYCGLTDEQIRQLRQVDFQKPETITLIVNAVPLRAPADGWLVGFDAIPGQIVRPQDKPFEIQDLSKVWAQGFVFEADAPKLSVGQKAQVTFAAYPDLVVPGKIVHIAPTLEAAERVLPVWIEVDNPDLKLKQGMLAKVTVFTNDVSDVPAPAHDSPQAGKTEPSGETR